MVAFGVVARPVAPEVPAEPDVPEPVEVDDVELGVGVAALAVTVPARMTPPARPAATSAAAPPQRRALRAVAAWVSLSIMGGSFEGGVGSVLRVLTVVGAPVRSVSGDTYERCTDGLSVSTPSHQGDWSS
jgi:hypothetical protein